MYTCMYIWQPISHYVFSEHFSCLKALVSNSPRMSLKTLIQQILTEKVLCGELQGKERYKNKQNLCLSPAELDPHHLQNDRQSL